jgi:hypothetical protein
MQGFRVLSRPFASFRVLSRVLGIVLLVAAAAKIHGLAVSPVSPVGFFSQAWVQVAVVQLEILLGLWFLTGKAPALAWLSALSLFGAFATITFYEAIVGQASCGCMGKIEVNPWIAFALDSVALALLLWCMPTRDVWAKSLQSAPTAWLGESLWALIGSVALVGGFSVAGLVWLGSVDAALAVLRGDIVSVEPSFVDLGQAAAAETREAKIQVTNRLAKPLTIIGGTSDCSCVATRDLPIELEPGATATLHVRVRYPNDAGRFMRTAAFIADSEGWLSIPFHISGVSSGNSVAANRE